MNRLVTHETRLASTNANQGASLVGVEDSAGHFTGDTVEEVLAELAAGIGITDVAAAAATELTIAAGVITATQTYHTIDTEADAASDDLDTVNGLADGQFYIFQNVNAGRNVVVKHGTGNIINPSGRDITLDVTNDKIFAFSNGVSLFVLDMSLATPANGGLASALAAVTASQGASLVGIQDALTLYAAATVEAALAEVRTTALVKAATGLTIAAGVITATQSYHTVDTEAAAASDDIDTINGLTDGGVYFFRLADITHNVVFKNGVGNIFCPEGFDVTLDVATDCALVLGIGAFAVVIAFKTASFAGGGVGARLNSAANGQGASLVSIEDGGSSFTATNVEAALAELAAYHVVATVACADAAGGATDALMSIQLRGLNNLATIGDARQVLLQIGSVQYNDGAGPGDVNISLGTVTAGAIVATPVAGGLFLVQTNAAGLFACTVTNTADTTRYFSAKTAEGGVSAIGERCVVVGSTSDAATWSA